MWNCTTNAGAKERFVKLDLQYFGVLVLSTHIYCTMYIYMHMIYIYILSLKHVFVCKFSNCMLTSDLFFVIGPYAICIWYPQIPIPKDWANAEGQRLRKLLTYLIILCNRTSEARLAHMCM